MGENILFFPLLSSIFYLAMSLERFIFLRTGPGLGFGKSITIDFLFSLFYYFINFLWLDWILFRVAWVVPITVFFYSALIGLVTIPFVLLLLCFWSFSHFWYYTTKSLKAFGFFFLLFYNKRPFNEDICIDSVYV